jgi:hypothetical protein
MTIQKRCSAMSARSIKLNDQTVGTAEVIGHIAKWSHVSLSPGSNKIEVESEVQNTVLRDSAEWTYLPLEESLLRQ